MASVTGRSSFLLYQVKSSKARHLYLVPTSAVVLTPAQARWRRNG